MIGVDEDMLKLLRELLKDIESEDIEEGEEMYGDSIRVTENRLSESTGIAVLDKALKSVSHLVEPAPYVCMQTGFFGEFEVHMIKVTGKLVDFAGLGDEDDNNPVKEINCPPFVQVAMSQNYIGTLVGEGWRMTVSVINKIRHNGQYCNFINWNPQKKFESVLNLLIMLKISGHDVNGLIKEVLFEAINRKYNTSTGSIELAGVDDVLKECLETLKNEDGRLVSRHVLLAGPPGCGKSELVKAIVRDTPDWVHYTLNNDIKNWSNFMRSLDKLMKFLGKRVMIIIDEIDEIGLSRNHPTTQVYDLLRVMDGVTDMGHIKFVATTNRPKVLDGALKRIGRFGPVRFMDKPDDAAFIEIIEFYNDRYGSKVDAKKIVQMRDGAVGGELRAAFEDCIIHGEEITTENVMKRLIRILESKKIEMKDFME